MMIPIPRTSDLDVANSNRNGGGAHSARSVAVAGPRNVPAAATQPGK
jgi:hypothetical protein